MNTKAFVSRAAFVGILFFALGFLLGLFHPASAHAAGDINCAHPAQGPQEECIEDVLGMEHITPDPIGYVAYSAPRCEYLLIREYNGTGSFVLAEYLRSNNDGKPHRGYEIHSKYQGFSRTFEADTRVKYRVGYDFLKLAVEQTDLTANEAVAAYVSACAR